VQNWVEARLCSAAVAILVPASLVVALDELVG